MQGIAILAGIAASLTSVYASPVSTLDSRVDLQPRLNGTNDWNCKSDKNPIVLVHALFVNRDLDLNFFEAWVRPQGYCTYSVTYGEYHELPFIGGLKPIAESSQEIVDLINEVLDKTGAKKVDVVGHSEGGLQALYVAKVRKMSDKIDKIVGIAPVTHGTDFDKLVNLAELLNIRPPIEEILKTVGCPACVDILTDSAIIRDLNDGPIVQPGNKVTIISTKYDHVVTPAGTASFINEPGVHNLFTQDVCPIDLSGHISIAIDTNMFHMTLNALQDKNGKAFICAPFLGPPIKK